MNGNLTARFLGLGLVVSAAIAAPAQVAPVPVPSPQQVPTATSSRPSSTVKTLTDGSSGSPGDDATLVSSAMTITGGGAAPPESKPAPGAAAPAALTYVESSTGLSTPQLGTGLTEIELCDIDGEGNVDIVSIGDHGNPLISSGESGLMVWFGNGAGAWSNFQTGNFGYGGIALGDLNGDGKIDAAYAMHHNYSSTDFGDQLIEAALGDGTGRNWTPWDDGLGSSGETYGMFASDLADVDDDGDLDDGIMSFGCCNGFHVYLNHRDGTWSQSFADTGGNTTTNEFVFGDVDGDGNPDIATGYDHGTVWLGDGTGRFTLADGNLPAGGQMGRQGPALADVNADGRDDLSWVNTAGGVEVWLYSGNATWTNASTGLPATGRFETTQMDDMNGDGTIDVVAFGNGTVTVWTGNGGAGWTQAASFTVGNPGYEAALRVGDIDHNGRPDIALVEEQIVSGFQTRNMLKVFKESSTASALSIRATYPRGGEKLAAGGVRWIRWASGVPGGATSRVKLEYSTSGTGGPWTLIADNLPNNGRYQWTVPASAASSNVFVRYTVTSPAAAASLAAAGAADGGQAQELPAAAETSPLTTVTATTPRAFSIVVVDSDGDGVPNWQDCAPGDAGARSAPVEVAGLHIARDPIDPQGSILASWTSQSSTAGPGTVYDLITGPTSDLGADGVLDLATCRADNVGAPSASVPLQVPPGAASYLLVRAQNSCGTAPWGFTSAAVALTSTACP